MTTKPIEPVVLDMFAPDPNIPYKAALSMFLYPFFHLGRNPIKVTTEAEWEEQGRHYYIKRVPSAEYGQPTILDFDYLIGAVSLAVHAQNKGYPSTPRIKLAVHDLLEYIGRGTSGREYKNFQAAMRRLTTSTVFTNIQSGNFSSETGFNWIQSFRINKRKHGAKEVMESVELVLCDWLYEAIVSFNILSIDRTYFDHTSTLERKLYLLFRAHLGSDRSFMMQLSRVHLKSGSQSPKRHFAAEMKEIVRQQPFKDFYVVLTDNGKEVPSLIVNPDDVKARDPIVHVIRRNPTLPLLRYF